MFMKSLMELNRPRKNTVGKIYNLYTSSILRTNAVSSIHHSRNKFNNTTGWTEETRNQFHPGDIITALRLDYSGYSPHKMLGVTELACHCLGEGRESCQPHIGKDGSINGFYFNVIPRIKCIQKELRNLYPEITQFSDALSTLNLKEIFNSPELISLLIKEIETQFSETIVVLPFNLSEEDRYKNIEEARTAFLDKVFKKPETETHNKKPIEETRGYRSKL